ncbi:NACHT domain-containing protein [Aerosakkonemataceae cyanobacterium BLCC-F154]|uniref:NACHT domain-containing protein n=1 Tax=Floridaenema fluviatile BLCC-F154 TaxID=3153640 RepID=A0ABV4Y6B1_9CYAN
MTSNQNQLEELFPEAYRNFEFEQLFADLEKALKEVLKKNRFMPASKLALVGRLCGYGPAQIAGKVQYTDGTLGQALSREIYPAIKKLLQLEEEIDWANADLLQLLEKYRKKSQKSLNIDISGICEQLRDRCGELLQHQKGLSTNSLMARDGVTFEVDDLFLPLGLEEHRKPAKQKDISSTEQGSIFYAPYEEENKKRFKDREFFEEVIRKCETPKSQGRRIVIIGEPGAGKTTLLQKIGDELQKNKTIPIWISLSRIASKPLSKYLLEDWLRDAAQALETAPAEWRTALEELLKTGQVCLLLDGADEMIVGANERIPLLDIGYQLREGWAQKVRVILTCRLNVWENNALEEFDVYRTLNFDYPTQVEQFINNFFNRELIDSQLAKDLKAELQLQTKARIRDLVKNPLRLSLLCYAWELGIGSLPDTKAELYELFVQAFYRLHELKDSKLKVPFEKQEELKKALGNLSKEALDSKKFRFLLPQSFIERFLGNPNDEKSLFWLAIKQLSWLNCVGRIAEKPFENAYAFFHPTFQEYFAALAIDDWHFFLNHVHENPDKGNYRIFESQWKEVILLWLGRQGNITFNNQKETFIKELVNFQDGCSKLYYYQAYFLAASGIAEFKYSSLADVIVNQLIKWSLVDPAEYLINPYSPMKYQAVEVLQNTDRLRAVNCLIENLHQNQNEEIHYLIASRLLEVDSNNQKAVDTLINLLDNNHYIDMTCRIISILSKVSCHNPKVIATLRRFLTPNNDTVDRCLAACGLLKMIPNDSEALNTLNELLSNPLVDYLAASCLRELGILDERFDFYLTSFEEPSNWKLVNYELSLLGLEQLKIENLEKEAMNIVNLLIAHLCSQPSNRRRLEIANSLQIIIFKTPTRTQSKLLPLVVTGLKSYLEDFYTKNHSTYGECFQILWHCAQNMSYPDFYRAWHNLSPSTHPEAPDNIPVGKSSIIQNLNFTQLPSKLNSAIANDEELNKAVKLICIDINNEFSNTDMLAVYIYRQMVKQGCPKCSHESPTNMPLLSIYWDLDLGKLEKRVALLFYNSKNDRTLNPSFLSDIATFGGTIAIISDEPCNNVRLISPNDPNLIDTVLKWLSRKILED